MHHLARQGNATDALLVYSVFEYLVKILYSRAMALFKRKKTKTIKGKRRKKKGKSTLKRILRPAGFLIDPKARKRARLNQSTRYPWELFFVDEPARFDEQVGVYSSYEDGRVVKVHVIPAPWSRVILYSVLYAFVIGVTKFCVFYTFGKPNWMMAYPPTELEADLASSEPG